jgi:hypothetical protein
MRRQQKSVWVSSYIFPVSYGPTVTSSDHSSLLAGWKSQGMIVVVAVNNLLKGLDRERSFCKKAYKIQISTFCSYANVFVIFRLFIENKKK